MQLVLQAVAVAVRGQRPVRSGLDDTARATIISRPRSYRQTIEPLPPLEEGRQGFNLFICELAELSLRQPREVASCRSERGQA